MPGNPGRQGTKEPRKACKWGCGKDISIFRQDVHDKACKALKESPAYSKEKVEAEIVSEKTSVEYGIPDIKPLPGHGEDEKKADTTQAGIVKTMAGDAAPLKQIEDIVGAEKMWFLIAHLENIFLGYESDELPTEFKKVQMDEATAKELMAMFSQVMQKEMSVHMAFAISLFIIFGIPIIAKLADEFLPKNLLKDLIEKAKGAFKKGKKKEGEKDE